MAKQYIPPATWSPVSTNSNGGNFTFTSPAVYVAHRSIDRIVYISGMDVHWPTTFVWGTVTRVRTAGIIPIAASDVFPARSASSLLTASGVEYAQLVANGSCIPMLDRQPHKKRYTYEPMTFGDLEEPMPASLYYNARSIDFWGKQSHWNNNGTRISAQATPRPSVWKSLFGGLMCEDPLLADPPIAFQRVEPGDNPEPMPKSCPISARPFPRLPEQMSVRMR
jgi:hypothetical protein